MKKLKELYWRLTNAEKFRVIDHEYERYSRIITYKQAISTQRLYGGVIVCIHKN